MNIKPNNLYENPGLILDGFEDMVIKSEVLVLLNNGDELCVRYDHRDRELNWLRQNKHWPFIEHIIASCSLEVKESLIYGTSLRNRMRLIPHVSFTRAKSNTCYFVVYSFGEYQPARYMLYLEGVWEIENQVSDFSI